MMATRTLNTPADGRLLMRYILMEHLQRATPGYLPGGDGLTVDDLLRDYPRLAARGIVPGQRQLQRNHPEVTGELAAFFSSPAAPLG